MKIYTSYSIKIKKYDNIFKDTVAIYREAVDFFIDVCMREWDGIVTIGGDLLKQQYVERLCHKTSKNTAAKYQRFDNRFYKFPSYLRRGAINEAIGKVSSYRSNLLNWEETEKGIRGRKPSYPKAGHVYPCMYRTVMYKQTSTYEAKIKVYVRNTWDWTKDAKAEGCARQR